MEKDFLILFGFKLEVIEEIIQLVTAALIKAIREETTINGIKTAALNEIIETEYARDRSPEWYAAVGVMVEQAYSAAVAASRKRIK